MTVWVREWLTYDMGDFTLHETEAGAKEMRGGREGRLIPMAWTAEHDGAQVGKPVEQRDRDLAMFRYSDGVMVRPVEVLP